MSHHHHDHEGQPHSHHHDHAHDNGVHSHEHSHGDYSHSHPHTHGEHAPQALSVEEKIAKILDHWIQHNDDHAQSYKKWADEARAAGKNATADLLEEVAAKTLEITEIFKKAVDTL